MHIPATHDDNDCMPLLLLLVMMKNQKRMVTFQMHSLVLLCCLLVKHRTLHPIERERDVSDDVDDESYRSVLASQHRDEMVMIPPHSYYYYYHCCYDWRL